MSVTSGGTALKPCSSGGRSAGSAGSAGISITFRTAHLPFLPLPFAIPQPDRRREVLERDDDADEAVGLRRIVRRPQLEHHLLLGAQVERLQVAALVAGPRRAARGRTCRPAAARG